MDLSLRILLEAQDSATSVVKNLGHAVEQIASGNVLGGVATIAATAAGAVVGFGVAATKAAGDFQQMSNTLVTSAGESQKNLSMVRNGILDISVSTATSTDQLVKAMYQIESSGKHGSDGLTVLKTAAQGAKAENADLEVVAKALTTVLTDYHMSANQSTSAMNGLIATVSSGKTTLQELSGSMGAVLPIAAALHVSFPQVAGAMATMTNAGMSARQAAQNLAHVLLSLESPNGVAVKSMKVVGLTADQVKDALVHQGLPEALQMIEDHVGKKFPASSVDYQTALKNIVGGQVGFKLAAMLTGQSLKDTEANIKAVSAAMQQGGSAVAGFDVVQQSFNFRLEQAKQAWNALLIQVGTALLPVLTQLMEKVTPLIIQVTDWAIKNHVVEQAIAAVQSTIQAWMPVLSQILAQVARLIGIVLDWAEKNHVLEKAVAAVQMALTMAVTIITGAISVVLAIAQAVQGVIVWFQTWEPVIQAVGTAILIFFAPALIKAGVEATLAGVKIATNFVASMVQAGVEAVVNGAKVTTSFVAALIKAGVEGWTSLPKIGAFIASLAATGAAAVVNAAKVTGSFIASMIVAGAQAVASAARIVASFVASLVTAGIQAAISAGIMLSTLVPSLLATAAAALLAAAPFILVGIIVAAVVVGIILAIKNWGAISAWLQGVWTAFSAWFTSAMQAVGAFFTGLWQGMQSFFQSAWNVIISIGKIAVMALFVVITGPMGLLVIFMAQHWTQISQAIQTGFSAAIGFVRSIWTTISGIFTSAWSTYIAQPLTQLWNTIVGGFRNLVSNASNWGKSLIQGFINGITSMFGAIGNAASGAMNIVRNFLGFHSPAKEGPGADLMNWGPGLIQGFSQGMLNALPTLQGAVSVTAQQLSPLSSRAGGAAGGSTGSGGNVFNITINTGYLKDRTAVSQLVDALMQEIDRRTRGSGNFVTWTSGGKA